MMEAEVCQHPNEDEIRMDDENVERNEHDRLE